MADDSILYKITGFVEIEKPDPPTLPGGQLPGISSRPNAVPSPRPPINTGGWPNLPPWAPSGGYPWQPGSATARPPSYGGTSSGGSGDYLLIEIDSINAFIQSGGIPRVSPPPAPMIGM